ncbi:MAG TPA: carbon-nitrogen hydrolase family protein [Solirubrobacterales bacterium]|nr:carbon-nitrogen hydrolase family protein [Solirubrobacterales bacterium]
MSSDRLRTACVQLNAGPAKAKNIEVAGALVAEAAAAGAELVVLPEKWNGYGTPEVIEAAAERIEDGESVRAMAAWARAHGIVIVGGSITEARGGGAKPANASIVFDRQGEIAAVYRKIHMFDVDVGGVSYRESATEDAGEEAVICEVDGWRLGLSICYDLRFPELYRELALAGAEIVVVPAAFTLATGKDHWELLLRARATENQCFVVAPNQWGVDAGGRHLYGRSSIVDPWGVVRAQAADADGVALADLDRRQMTRIRAEFPALSSRRPQAYRAPRLAAAGASTVPSRKDPE